MLTPYKPYQVFDKSKEEEFPLAKNQDYLQLLLQKRFHCKKVETLLWQYEYFMAVHFVCRLSVFLIYAW